MFLFILLLSFTQRHIVFSQDSGYDVSITEDCEPGPSYNGFPAIPCGTNIPLGSAAGQAPRIDGNTRTIHVTFHGLSSNTDYYLCGQTNTYTCASAIEWSNSAVMSDGKGDLTANACPSNRNTLKSAPDGKTECGDSDYFWEGHTYHLWLFQKADNNKVSPLQDVQFFVSHYYPEVDVSPTNPTNNSAITVAIKGTRRPHNDGRRNNYKIQIRDQYADLAHDCGVVYNNGSGNYLIKVPENGPGKPGYTFSLKQPGKHFPVGNYEIIIGEQVNESTSGCSDGFQYYTIPVSIKTDGGSIGDIQADPAGTDFPEVEKNFGTPPLPCLSPAPGGGCKTISTAIGDINTDPAGFIKFIFGLILGLSGGIALILIIISGYKFMASRGNPEALQGAQEQLTSAIIGLLFIIFSLVILQIIGVDILKIPGFR